MQLLPAGNRYGVSSTATCAWFRVYVLTQQQLALQLVVHCCTHILLNECLQRQQNNQVGLVGSQKPWWQVSSVRVAYLKLLRRAAAAVACKDVRPALLCQLPAVFSELQVKLLLSDTKHMGTEPSSAGSRPAPLSSTARCCAAWHPACGAP